MKGVLHVRPIIGKAGAEKFRVANGLSLFESRVVFQSREFWGGQKARPGPESRELGPAWCVWSCATEIGKAKGKTRPRSLRGTLTVIQNAVVRALVVLALPLSAAAPASAASFDCAKAHTEVERLICKYPDVSALDSRMAVLYEQALARIPNPQALRTVQRNWLTYRDGMLNAPFCPTSCDEDLAKLYENRIHQLQMRYLSPPQGAPTALELLRTQPNTVAKSSPGLEGTMKTSRLAFCNRLLAAARSGQGIRVIAPTLANVTYDSPQLQTRSKGCSTKISRHQVHKFTAYTAYDNYDAWFILTPKSKLSLMLLHNGGWYWDAKLSLIARPPFWAYAPTVTGVLLNDRCKRTFSFDVTHVGLRQNAPPLKRESQLLEYEGKYVFLNTGNSTYPDKPMSYLIDVVGIDLRGYQVSMCYFDVN